MRRLTATFVDSSFCSATAAQISPQLDSLLYIHSFLLSATDAQAAISVSATDIFESEIGVFATTPVVVAVVVVAVVVVNDDAVDRRE